MCKILLIKTLKFLFGIIDLIFFFNKKDIIFHGYLGNPSGNTLALYNYIKKNNLIDCKLFWTGKIENFGIIDSTYFKPLPSRNSSIFSHLNFLFFLMKFKIIIVASAGDLSFYLQLLPNRFRLKILLGHGVSLKSGGVLAKHLSKQQQKIWSKVGKNFNIFSVSSQLEKNILALSLNISPSKCIIMGPQRPLGIYNSSKEAKKNAIKIIENTYCINLENNHKIIFYAPTHRDHLNLSNRPTLFDFSSYEKLNQTLVKHNSITFIREHGISNNFKEQSLTNIINTAKFASIDFHYLFPAVDYLITDYSGIFLEYLNSKIKFGFWQYDLTEFRKLRGLSLDGDIFKTGNKIYNEKSFEDFIKSKYFPKKIKLQRNYWHNRLYENTTKEALKLSVNEIKRSINLNE